MRLRWIALGVVGFAIWLATTFGVAFAVVEWRASDSEPDFFCRETFRAFLDHPTDNLRDALIEACEGQWPSN